MVKIQVGASYQKCSPMQSFMAVGGGAGGEKEKKITKRFWNKQIPGQDLIKLLCSLLLQLVACNYFRTHRPHMLLAVIGSGVGNNVFHGTNSRLNTFKCATYNWVFYCLSPAESRHHVICTMKWMLVIPTWFHLELHIKPHIRSLIKGKPVIEHTLYYH